MSSRHEAGTIRSFVAFDPSPEIRARLLALRDALAASGADARWVRDENAHCTLKFLGNVAPARIEEVHAVLAATLRQARPFEVVVRGAGAFPSARNPRVVWAGLEGEGAPALAAAVDSALAPLGFALEDRPFRAHVTLGRIRGRRGAAALTAALEAHAADELGRMRVEQVVLYASRPRSGGSLYTPLHVVALGGFWSAA